VLKEAVLRYDPCRCYLESSPFYSDKAWKDVLTTGKTDVFMPENHLYPDVMNYDKAFRETPYRFVGETGPILVNAMTENPEIIARELPRAKRLWDKEIAPDNRNLDMHQRDDYFMTHRQTGKEVLEQMFGRDFTVDEINDYILAVNILCSHVFKDVIEYGRSQKWNKTGVLWWSLLDMWPMMFNYSVVDYDFLPKMPYYWIRQSQQYFCLLATREQVGGDISLFAANETLSQHSGNYSIYSVTQSGERGEVVASGRFESNPNETRKIQLLPEVGRQEMWIIEWEEDGKKSYNHYAAGNAPFDFEVWRNWEKYLKELYSGN